MNYLSFKSISDFWLFSLIFLYWITIYIIEYKCNWKYKTYKNFLFYMFADKDAPFSNFVHSILTFGFVIWIIRFIYTLIYGIR